MPTQSRTVERVAPRRFRFKPGRVVLYLVLSAWAAITVAPFIWMLLNSLKYPYNLYRNPFGFPKELYFKNYVVAWVQAHMGRFSLNSLLVTVVSTVVAMLIAATCGFALGRFSFRLKGLIWAYVLLGFLMPDTVRLLPLAIFTRKVGLYDSLLGLAVIYAARGLPWNTFFLASFMETIPRELEEAAVMDGAGMGRVFWNIILPISQPAIVTMATFHVLYCWNEFVLALLLTGSQATRTLPVGVRFLMGEFYSNETALMAALVIAIIPAAIFFLFLQRYVVKGMIAGSLKGV